MAKRKAFEPEMTRTIALIGHRSVGKTSLGEVLLRVANVTRIVGSVDRRTSLLDHTDEERRRGQSLQLGYAWMEWGEHQINLIDIPGGDAVAHEQALGLSGVDGALVVIDATAGVQIGTERALQAIKARGLPWMVAINKVDRAQDIPALLDDLGAQLPADTRLAQLQLPFMEEGSLTGVISVLDGVAYRYDEACGTLSSPEPLPARYQSEVMQARERLTELVALTDDALLEEYLEYLELPTGRLMGGLAAAVRAGRIAPVLLTSAARGIGAQGVLKRIAELMPSPVQRPPTVQDADGAQGPLDLGRPFVAQMLSAHTDDEGAVYRVFRVFSGTPPRGGWSRIGPRGPVPAGKVQKLYQIRGPRRAAARTVGPGALLATWEPLDLRPGDTVTDGANLRLPPVILPAPMMAYVVAAARPGAPARQALFQAATALAQRDLALQLEPIADPSAPPGSPPAQLHLSGLGEAHLRLVLDRLRQAAGELRVELPPVEYRETPTAPAFEIQGVYRTEDQFGLVHEYGQCKVDVAPLPPDEGLRFVDTLPLDDVDELPSRFRPAVEAGLRHAARQGPAGGYPVVGLQVTLKGGAYDILQSTPEHFHKAGEKALQAALQRTGTRLLEPWLQLEIDVPQESVGVLVSELTSHRGRVLSIDNGVAPGDRSGRVRVVAASPQREARTFAPRLQAVTQGRGLFQATLSHYEPLPRHLEREALAASPARRAVAVPAAGTA